MVRYLYNLATEMGVGVDLGNPIPALATAWQQDRQQNVLLATQLQGVEQRLRDQTEELLTAQQRVKDLEVLLETVLQRGTEPRISGSLDHQIADADRISTTEGDDLPSSLSLSSPEESCLVSLPSLDITPASLPSLESSTVSRPVSLPSDLESFPEMTHLQAQTDGNFSQTAEDSASNVPLDEEYQPIDAVLLSFQSIPTPPESPAENQQNQESQGEPSLQEFLGQDRTYILPPIESTGLIPAGDFRSASPSSQETSSVSLPSGLESFPEMTNLQAQTDGNSSQTAEDSASNVPLDEEYQPNDAVLLSFQSVPTPPESPTENQQNQESQGEPSPQEFLGQDRTYILPPIESTGPIPAGDFRSASPSSQEGSLRLIHPALNITRTSDGSSEEEFPSTTASSSNLNSSSSSISSSGAAHVWTSAEAFTSIHKAMQSITPPRCDNMVRELKDIALWSTTSTARTIELGRGSNGAVYLFRHAMTKDPIALKNFPLSREPAHRQRQLYVISEEAGIQKDLSAFRNFPRYYGYATVDCHTLALAMEFVGDAQRGKSITLADSLERRPSGWTQEEKFTIALDIVEGVVKMHQQGFLINDLKCNNILLSEEEGRLRAKIIDFGHATRLACPSRIYCLNEDAKRRYRTEGLYNHVAPEVALDGQMPSIKSDTFQIGRVFVRMGNRLHLDALLNIGLECCDLDPTKRPSLVYVSTVLKAIELALQ
ncbi:serine-rich adhesin for platelets-like [Lytechinus variegatus]|uniref:serine-rich adhesin for platelets-like n=1 Tax=Lytechinus variegatus TaxID=7654 RepID=UPI001BB20471|nr:serine-rich adhesin for platelets-like [Lytechinus variegatus]